jgi:hypothetical protein
MMRVLSSRYRLGSNNKPLLSAFRVAYSAAPVAVATAIALQIALGTADMLFAPTVASAGVLLLVLGSMITFVVSLAARNERAFLSSALLISAASAVADLPLHRSDAGVLAAVAGAMVLGMIEAGGAALEPRGGGVRLGRPARLHVVWVTAVALGGAVTGWLLLSLQPDVADLGLFALGLGVLAAIGFIVFAGALTGSALGADAGLAGRPAGGSAHGGFSPRGRRAPSRRGRRRARGTRPVPPARRPRSTPSSG